MQGERAESACTNTSSGVREARRGDNSHGGEEQMPERQEPRGPHADSKHEKGKSEPMITGRGQVKKTDYPDRFDQIHTAVRRLANNTTPKAR